jgi:hypothetical protein
MKKATITICMSLMASAVLADPPETNLIQKLTSVITNLCPEAEITVDEHAFSAKHDTMVYTIHSRSKTGEVYPTTHQQEGPAFRGFMLRVSLNDGEYGGAACVPQTLHGPYYPTFIDAPSISDGKKHYQVHFSYGGRLDPELKKAILETIPRTRFQQSDGEATSKTAPSAVPEASHP